jgi:hypothetical protein
VGVDALLLPPLLLVAAPTVHMFGSDNCGVSLLRVALANSGRAGDAGECGRVGTSDVARAAAGADGAAIAADVGRRLTLEACCTLNDA